MESTSAFHANKRYAMLFRRQSPPRDLNTGQFPGPNTSQLTPRQVSISSYRTPETIEEALALASKPSRPPRSKKTSHTTIHTEATSTQPAFESDAFAIQMPTTREPIIDTSIYRAKIPTPSRAQVEAYQTYKKKAEQVRERDHREGVRVPSKIVSYDYACTTRNGQPPHIELDVSPPSSPQTPAGSFPVSPPSRQQAWTRSLPRETIKRSHTGDDQVSWSMRDAANISIARRPVGLGNMSLNRPTYRRGDVDTGAAHSSPEPTPTKIRVRLKPRADLYSCSPQSSNPSPQTSAHSSRSPSPTKSTSAAIASIFGHGTHDITGTLATAKQKTKENSPGPENAKDKPAGPQKTTRWAWLRAQATKTAKPSAPKEQAIPAPEPVRSTYKSPFLQYSGSPATSRPASPKKLLRPSLPVPSQSSPYSKFQTGFSQLTRLTAIIVKVAIAIYALVALYFILDAIREAVHVLGAPFRMVRMATGVVWRGIAWLGMSLRGL